MEPQFYKKKTVSNYRRTEQVWRSQMEDMNMEKYLLTAIPLDMLNEATLNEFCIMKTKA